MGRHVCSMCPFFCHSEGEFLSHLFKYHKHSAKFIVHCTVCGASYRNVKSFKSHLHRKHFCCDYVTDSDEASGYVTDRNDEASGFSACSSTANVTENNDSTRSEGIWMLNLLTKYRVSETAVGDIVESVGNLFDEKLKEVCRNVQQALAAGSSNVDECFNVKLFTGLNTKRQQQKFIETCLPYVKPKPVILGNKLVNRKIGGKLVLTEQQLTGYVVPFLSQLSVVLSMPEVNEVLNSSHASDDFMYDFSDGAYCQTHSFVQSHPGCLLLAIYTDDFEIANPIGSHKKKHKVTAFYWTILNIPAEYRSQLSTIQLLALAKTSHVRKFGFTKLTDDFVQGLQTLWRGFRVDIQERFADTYYGILVAVLADTPAAQALGGFKESVGVCRKPCRTCEISTNELHGSTHEGQFTMRDEEEHRDRVAWLEQQNQHARRYWSMHYGVNGGSFLLDIPGFSITKCLLHDPMHVLLEGVVRVELKAMLRHFVVDRHFFSLHLLNRRITQYDYNDEELKNKPQIIEREQLVQTGAAFSQSAASMRVLINNLPYMIADVIPEDDHHWKTFISLLQICILCFSPIATIDTVSTLKHLIASHNQSFVELYGQQQYVPKLHFLTHLPEQLRLFGPIKNHSCMRFEAKNGFFKLRRWFNFRNIPLSLSVHHQRWMCLQMSDVSGLSHSYLYCGDDVFEGRIASMDECLEWKSALSAILAQEGHIIDDEVSIMLSPRVVIHGLCYAVGSILVVSNDEVPEFMAVKHIAVIEHSKYFLCVRMRVVDFTSHTGTFTVQPSDHTAVITYSDLVYKWPQHVKKLSQNLSLIMQNVDDIWTV